jgi:hypothetical protein
MRRRGKRDGSSGFALILTIVLLAFLVLAVYGLSVITRVGVQTSASVGQQTVARQNALLGLSLAIGELQRTAGDDSRITGMAGIAGVGAGANNVTRYWCGVWESDGEFVTWLASGAVGSTAVSGEAVELVSNGSVGTASGASSSLDKERVIVGKVPVVVARGGADARAIGHYAYVVVDEGVKVSAYAPESERMSGELVPVIGDAMPGGTSALKLAIQNNPAKLEQLVSFEQLALLPPKPSVQDTFHFVTLTARAIVGNELRTGVININTASALTWRCLLDTYNVAGADPIGDVEAKGNSIAAMLAGSMTGKGANRPFTSVAGLGAFLESEGLFPATGTPTGAQIAALLEPVLVVRSDTFRVRAYGDAIEPVDGTVEAKAYCEAIVQRMPEEIGGGFGRRLVVIYFRWLARADI